MKENEIWAPVSGYIGCYEISNSGRIKSLRRVIIMANGCKRTVNEKILKPTKNTWGYPFVSIRPNGSATRINEPIHRLVSEAFLPNEYKKPCVNHKDGNKENNNVSNLEWCTYSENERHAFDILLRPPTRGENHGNAKLKIKEVVAIKKMLYEGYTHQIISDMFSVSRSSISLISRNINWKHVIV